MDITYQVIQLLKSQKKTLSIAESCTGGGLINEISSFPGVSDILVGGVTTYSNHAKERVLSIDKQLLERKGAVSQEVAVMMAQNCRKLFTSTFALSTTGIAGPSGGSLKKPVGLVFIGIAGPDLSEAQQFTFSHVSRLEHRQRSTEQALSMLKQHLCPEN